MFMIVCNEKLLREFFEEFTRRTEHEIRKGFEEIARAIAQPHRAVSSRLTFKNAKGEIDPMKTVLLTDQPGSYLYQEFAADGITVVAPTGTVQYASDSPAVATIDPVTGQLAYVGVGTANMSASDSGNLPATDPLTVQQSAPPPPPVAVSSTLTFVPPAAPAPGASGSASAAPAGNAASSSRSSHS